MKYKNLFLTLTGFLLVVFYALFKRAPTIHKSLVEDGYKLVSSSDKKEEIYTNILNREGSNINLIALDSFLIGQDRKWEALSFWCDLETNRNSFLRSFKYQIRFCVMAIEEWAKWEKKVVKELEFWKDLEPFLKNKFIKEVAKLTDDSNEVGQKWEEYCTTNKIKPYWRSTMSLAKEVLEYCFVK